MCALAQATCTPKRCAHITCSHLSFRMVVIPYFLLQVHVMEDEDQQIHFRNLNKHLANNEEDALNLVSARPSAVSGRGALEQFLCVGGGPGNWPRLASQHLVDIFLTTTAYLQGG